MIELKIAKDIEWGFYITYKVIIDQLVCWPRPGSDNYWIKRLEIDKDFYLDTLIKKYNAYNNANYKFPKLFFKNKEDAELAMTEFYEPMLILKKLME